MGFLRRLAGSLYSVRTYREVRASQGHGLLYSLYLLMLASAVLVAWYLYALHVALFVPQGEGRRAPVAEVLMQVSEQVPEMTFEHDRLRTAKPGKYPIVLRMDGEETLLAIIDTSGRTTYKKMDAYLLLTGEEAITQDDDGVNITPYRELELDLDEPVHLTREDAKAMAESLLDWIHDARVVVYAFIGGMMWLTFVATWYIGRVLLMLALALGGMVLGAMTGRPISYEAAMRVTALAMTPVTLFDTATLVGGGAPLSPLWTFLCGMVLLAAAVFATRETPLDTRP